MKQVLESAAKWIIISWYQEKQPTSRFLDILQSNLNDSLCRVTLCSCWTCTLPLHWCNLSQMNQGCCSMVICRKYIGCISWVQLLLLLKAWWLFLQCHIYTRSSSLYSLTVALKSHRQGPAFIQAKYLWKLHYVRHIISELTNEPASNNGVLTA